MLTGELADQAALADADAGADADADADADALGLELVEVRRLPPDKPQEPPP